VALWPTAAALVGSVRNARTHARTGTFLPERHRRRLGCVVRRERDSRWPGARRRRRRRHGTARRCGQLADRSDLAMISAAPVRP
jgi:hypothetical protein